MKHTHLHILRPKLKIWSMLLPRESCEWAHTLICFAFWRQRSCYRRNFSHPGGFLKTSGFDNDQSFRYLDRGKGRDAEHVVMLRILSGYIKRFILYYYWNSIALWFSCTAWQIILKVCASLCIYTTQFSLTVSGSLSIFQATFLQIFRVPLLYECQ